MRELASQHSSTPSAILSGHGPPQSRPRRACGTCQKEFPSTRHTPRRTANLRKEGRARCTRDPLVATPIPPTSQKRRRRAAITLHAPKKKHDARSRPSPS
ncbi:hypothetical protein HYDPIDRAFT_118220 [Hydnomerulius pinastri MD-312]|uniref:Uncharacterized protein n=1 Tax=Hydnomerulius pinastri MD-312 TaxID=994086 RepID=A0A0C9VPX5_9AGAM|nr:hypothetical protein HYDPIDRAFT_118220 [Hydnomerulius pinastri MD-312]